MRFWHIYPKLLRTFFSKTRAGDNLNREQARTKIRTEKLLIPFLNLPPPHAVLYLVYKINKSGFQLDEKTAGYKIVSFFLKLQM